MDSHADQTESHPAQASSSQTAHIPELEAAHKRLQMARERFLSAAIAFCEGTISAGQLRAARELMREKELRVMQMTGGKVPSIMDEPIIPRPPTKLEEVDTGPLEVEEQEDLSIPADVGPALGRKLEELAEKYARLKEDFKRGHINAPQYRAIRKHYLEQREVALRLRETHPDSDRWQVVLEEGKTTFLMQLNEAACLGVGLYEIKTRERIYVQGDMPLAAEEAMGLLGTFGSAEQDAKAGRMYATQIEDGSSLLLIPGDYTVCLVAFSQAPPDWQVRALREVHRHFETANKTALERGKLKSLLFPNLRRFIRV